MNVAFPNEVRIDSADSASVSRGVCFTKGSGKWRLSRFDRTLSLRFWDRLLDIVRENHISAQYRVVKT